MRILSHDILRMEESMEIRQKFEDKKEVSQVMKEINHICF